MASSSSANRTPFLLPSNKVENRGAVDCDDEHFRLSCSEDIDCARCVQFSFVCDKETKLCEPRKDRARLANTFTSQYVLTRINGALTYVIECLFPDIFGQQNIFSNCNVLRKCDGNGIRNKRTGKIYLDRYDDIDFDPVKDGECVCGYGMMPDDDLNCVPAVFDKSDDCVMFGGVKQDGRCDCPDGYVYSIGDGLLQAGYKAEVSTFFQSRPKTCLKRPCEWDVADPKRFRSDKNVHVPGRGCLCDAVEGWFGVFVDEGGEGNAVVENKPAGGSIRGYNGCLKVYDSSDDIKAPHARGFTMCFIPPEGLLDSVFIIHPDRLVGNIVEIEERDEKSSLILKMDYQHYDLLGHMKDFYYTYVKARKNTNATLCHLFGSCDGYYEYTPNANFVLEDAKTVRYEPGEFDDHYDGDSLEKYYYHYAGSFFVSPLDNEKGRNPKLITFGDIGSRPKPVPGWKGSSYVGDFLINHAVFDVKLLPYLGYELPVASEFHYEPDKKRFYVDSRDTLNDEWRHAIPGITTEDVSSKREEWGSRRKYEMLKSLAFLPEWVG